MLSVTNDIKKEILLPEKIYGVEGMELNLYFHNLCLQDPELLCLDIESEKGVHMDKYWRYIPGQELETSAVVARIDYDGNILNKKECRIVSCRKEDKPQQKIRCLFIGDSLTQQLTYTQQFINLCTSAGLDVELIGTHGYKHSTSLKDNVHEGYGGWSLETHYKSPASPFVFDGQFSFNKYMEKSGFDHIDMVFFFLGPNDIVYMSNDTEIINKAEVNCRMYHEIISDIHGFDKNIHIGIATMLPPSASQDAFGCSYGTRFKRYRYIRNTHYYNLMMIKAFDGGKVENTGVVPLHVMFDTENNVSYDQRKANARSKNSLWVQNNAVHPVDEGYAQVADGFYFYLRNMLAGR